jgi:hypothetical protein
MRKTRRQTRRHATNTKTNTKTNMKTCGKHENKHEDMRTNTKMNMKTCGKHEDKYEDRRTRTITTGRRHENTRKKKILSIIRDHWLTLMPPSRYTVFMQYWPAIKSPPHLQHNFGSLNRQQLPRLIFLGFIRIYWKISIHFEINPTQFGVWGQWPEWGWGRKPKWGWGYEWGCTKILTHLINPQRINNSCGKNKSQNNKSWNPLLTGSNETKKIQYVIFVYSKSEYTLKSVSVAVRPSVRPAGRLHDNSWKTNPIELKFCT